ncbi:MAG TPA: outer membrane protein assembly factor BamE [Burkholderiales bacterium]|nr:outer membrane protein assembly factor BamE [Burkholderiales bacterium]
MSLKNNNLILGIFLVLMAGCKMSMPTLPGLGAHKIEIQQGNVITQSMLDKLQPGMTRNQVRFVLGTPLLVDPFRSDRWDYIYVMNKKGERVEQRQLKVYFKDDKMVRFEGDIVAETNPSTVPAAAGNPAAAKPVEKPVAVPGAPAATPVAPAAASPTPQPPVVTPATPTPAPETSRDSGKLQLQLAPGLGEPAKPEDVKPTAPVAPAAVTPRGPESLDAPPLPRLVLPPEQPEQQSSPAATPDKPAPFVDPAPVKP